MEIIESIQSIRSFCNKSQKPICLIPTMGALHEGHLSLAQTALKKAPSSAIIFSIFVNPAQFSPSEDLSKYPRQLEQDISKLQELGSAVQALFVPRVPEMYSVSNDEMENELQIIPPHSISSCLCGAFRPNLHKGVCLVLSKLFNIISPQYVILGEKDYQQIVVVKNLVQSLNFNTTIIESPTKREQSGLAMSSRNAYLTKDALSKASLLHTSMQKIKAAALSEERAVQGEIKKEWQHLEQQGFKMEYFEVRCSKTLKLLQSNQEIFDNSQPRIFIAAQLGNTRLIDNVAVINQTFR